MSVLHEHQPARVLADLALQPGAKVADIGCGRGYFTFALARAVGAEGVVFALDIDPKALQAPGLLGRPGVWVRGKEAPSGGAQGVGKDLAGAILPQECQVTMGASLHGDQLLHGAMVDTRHGPQGLPPLILERQRDELT